MPTWLLIIIIVISIIVGLIFTGILVIYFALFGRQDFPDFPSDLPNISDKITTTLVSEGYDSPIGFSFDNVNPNFYYVVDQVGKIYRASVADGSIKQVVLDVTKEVAPFIAPLDERGVLSVEFDRRPGVDYAYVTMTIAPTDAEQAAYGTKLDHVLALRRYSISRTNDSVQFYSPIDLVRIQEVEKFHHGGALQTSDRWLMLVSSDGGPQDDPFNHAQDLSLAKGKILVFDYTMLNSLAQPLDEKSAAPFIFVYGIRNAWKIYYDKDNDRLFVGDVGNQMSESAFEINNVSQLLANKKKVNLRWSAYEGFVENDKSKLRIDENTVVLEPIFSFRTGGKMGRVIIMGFPLSQNELLIGDYMLGNLLLLQKISSDPPKYAPKSIGGEFPFLTFLPSFGTDGKGNRYALTTRTIWPSQSGSSGKVYRIDVKK